MEHNYSVQNNKQEGNNTAEEEIENNNRARSARLRIAEKI